MDKMKFLVEVESLLTNFQKGWSSDRIETEEDSIYVLRELNKHGEIIYVTSLPQKYYDLIKKILAKYPEGIILFDGSIEKRDTLKHLSEGDYVIGINSGILETALNRENLYVIAVDHPNNRAIQVDCRGNWRDIGVFIYQTMVEFDVK